MEANHWQLSALFKPAKRNVSTNLQQVAVIALLEKLFKTKLSEIELKNYFTINEERVTFD